MEATLLPPLRIFEHIVLPPKASGGSLIYRLRVEQFDLMVQRGILDESDAVEFVDGVLYAKMPTNPPHDATASVSVIRLNGLSNSSWFARGQSTLALPDGRPEPDVAVLNGNPFDYAARHPTARDAAIVIEVSDTTLSFDRGTKLASYARAGVAEYWIVNLIDRQIEVHTQPVADAYAMRVVFASADTIALPATLGGATIAVVDLLPPA